MKWGKVFKCFRSNISKEWNVYGYLLTSESLTSKARAFETKSLRKRVYEFLDKYPESNIYTLYFEFPKAKKDTLKKYKCRYHREIRMTRNDLKVLIKHLETIAFILQYKVKKLHDFSIEERQSIIYMETFILNNGGSVKP